MFSRPPLINLKEKVRVDITHSVKMEEADVAFQGKLARLEKTVAKIKKEGAAIVKLLSENESAA